jgi:hypothetical protein
MLDEMARPPRPTETYEARKKRGRPIASFSLPEELLEELRTFATETDESQSSIVTKAVSAYLRRRRPR